MFVIRKKTSIAFDVLTNGPLAILQVSESWSRLQSDRTKLLGWFSLGCKKLQEVENLPTIQKPHSR